MINIRPLVSIIIPVYNGSDFLSEAIESALAQTYNNVEVLVVNDGSNDNGATERIALSYGNRIRYFAKSNGGVASALNRGIFEMRGDYFSWLSHDDIYLPQKVAVQVEHLANSSKKDIILFCDYINVDENNNALYPVSMDHNLLNTKPLYAVFRGALHGCTLLIPRVSFVQVGIFNDLRTTQDYDLWFRLIRRYKFVHIPEILVRSRLHPNQGSRNIDATAESNELWIRMMKSLTLDEILSLERSEKAFYQGMETFLATTPYVEALNFARERVDVCSSLVGYNDPLQCDRTNFRLMNKAKLKAVLIDLGVWKHIQYLRNRISSRVSKSRCLHQKDNEDKRKAAIFAETGKIMLKVLTGD